jgi:hypothetical protein
MPVNVSSNAELVRLAIAGIDAQIKELEAKKAGLAKLAGGRSAAVAAPAAAAPKAAKATRKKRGKRGPMSPEAKAKLAAVAKKRWAAVKRAGKSKL